MNMGRNEVVIVAVVGNGSCSYPVAGFGVETLKLLQEVHKVLLIKTFLKLRGFRL